MQVGHAALMLTKVGLKEQLKLRAKKCIHLNTLAEAYFVPIACMLFMHPEKLMVRICSCTFDVFHMFIINLM